MTKRILVVEDNDLNRKLFCDVLQASGFAVEPVAEQRIRDVGAEGYLAKPVSIGPFMAAVKGLVGQA